MVDGALLIAVAASTALAPRIPVGIVHNERVRASLVLEAQWEAQWIVEHALQFQRAEGRLPATVTEVINRFAKEEMEARAVDGPEWAEVETLDPWRRRWVFSVDDDVRVCTRGPAGTGKCQVGRLVTLPAEADGSAGYSSKLGGWGDTKEDETLQRLMNGLKVVLVFAPLLLYIAYRLVRGALGRPAPPLRAGRLVLALVALIVLAVVPLYANVAIRAMWASAQADVQALAVAIEVYRAHSGSPPAALSDLTAPARNARGKMAGPFMERLPLAMCHGLPYADGKTQTLNPRYTYRRWADGRYFLKCTQAFYEYPTVTQRGGRW